MMISDTQAVID